MGIRGRRLTLPVLILAFSVVALAQAPSSGTPNLGRAPTERELKAWDIAIGPDGTELPPGTGTPTLGAALYGTRGCGRCHGPNLNEGPAPKLVGSEVRGGRYPPGYWPFAPLIWDYINRAMPFDRPGFLSADEVYSLTAYLLYKNGAIEEGDIMDARSLPKVQMPHRDQFLPAPENWKPGTRPQMVTKP